jgi:hypothetical protein
MRPRRRNRACLDSRGECTPRLLSRTRSRRRSRGAEAATRRRLLGSLLGHS